MYERERANLDWNLTLALEMPADKYFSRSYIFSSLLLTGPQTEPKGLYEGFGFCDDVEKGKPISNETLQWLANGLRKNLESGKDIAAALGFKKKSRHMQERKKLHAGLRAFALVRCRNGDYNAVVKLVAEESALSEAVVKKQYADVKKHAVSIGKYKN